MGFTRVTHILCIKNELFVTGQPHNKKGNLERHLARQGFINYQIELSLSNLIFHNS